MPAKRIDQAKLDLVETLKKFNKPMTVGELFLVTEYSHTMIRKAFNQLKEEGKVDSKLKEILITDYSGKRYKRKALHWFLVEPKKNKP
jgi:hypothetical protein